MNALSRTAGQLAFGLAFVAVAALSAAYAQKRGHFKRLDVPYAETPNRAVAAMLALARVGPDDIVYDLGSGDGRIVIAAARDFGARFAVGVDIDPERVTQGQENARAAGVRDRTRFVQDDVFKVDFSEATVLTMFMATRIQTELLPRLRGLLKPGTRVVTYRFAIIGWEADTVIAAEGGNVYLWVVPEHWPERD